MNSDILHKLFNLLPSIKDNHNPDSHVFQFLKFFLEKEFNTKNDLIFEFEPFKNLKWKFQKLGNVDSLSYFNIYQFIQYAFFYANRKRYKVVFDVGSHIGGDSIILDKFGYKVNSYEPDRESYKNQVENIKINKSKNIKLFNLGLSDKKGKMKFVKIINNSFSNHIVDSKQSYGPIQYENISTITFRDIKEKPDLMKINIEGHEIKLIPSIDESLWDSCDALIELHGEESVKSIFNYFKNFKKINIFSQKISWNRVSKIKEMPINYKEGVIFVSTLDEMPWS